MDLEPTALTLQTHVYECVRMKYHFDMLKAKFNNIAIHFIIIHINFI